jgi:hypothetical protein
MKQKMYQIKNVARMVGVKAALRATLTPTIRAGDSTWFSNKNKCMLRLKKINALYQNYTAILYQNKNAIDTRTHD